MNILLVTTELAPLTGDTPLGGQAASLAHDLHQCTDTDAVIVMPSSDSVREKLTDRISDTGISISLPAVLGDPGGTRISGHFLELTLPGGPQLFLLESDDLAGYGGVNANDPSSLLLWARLVVDLLVRLRPPISIVHCFCWSSALIPLLIRGRMLPYKTVFSSFPDAGDVATLDEIARVTGEAGLEEITGLISNTPTVDSTPALVRDCTDGTPLPGTGSERAGVPPGNETLTPSRKAEARNSLSVRYELSPDARGPLIYVPTTNPSPLLPLLDRLLAANASVILQFHVPGESRPDLQARLITYQLRYPGVFAWFKSDLEADNSSEWLLAADVMLLLPADTASPEIVDAAHEAFSVKCTPIVPRHDSLLPVISSHINEQGQLRPSAFSYRAETSEAIWAAIKRCLRRLDAPESEQACGTNPANVAPAPEEQLPMFHKVYRGIARSSLTSEVS